MAGYRIFMIGWEYPPHITGGLGIACRGLARALAARGNEVWFLVPRLHGDEAVEPGIHLMDVSGGFAVLNPQERVELGFALQKHEGRFAFGPYDSADAFPTDDAIANQMEVREEERGSGTPALQIEGGYTDRIWQDIHEYGRFAGMLARHLYAHVIHAHDWMTYPAGLAAARDSGRPLVCHAHATEIDRSGDHVNQYVYDLERQGYHESAAVITVSNYTRTVLADRYAVPEAKIFPVHNGVDFEIPAGILRPEPSSRPVRDHIVLFLGRLTFQKGPDYFVRAAQKVVAQMNNVRFVMAGTGDMYHRMIELAADLGIGKYFHYTGFLDHAQVRRLYQLSDLYIMPSVSEPFGISPLEAMLHGVPVIVSKQSGVQEVIQNRVAVDFWDVDSLAHEIVRLLTDPEAARSLQEGGRSEAGNVTWAVAAEKVEAVYGRVAAASANV